MSCLLVILLYVCYSSVAAVSYRQYNFTNKDIRLVGGNSELEGRVEIRKHGIWGTVCSIGFDGNDANELCRMLHTDLRALEYYTDGRYGDGRGPIFYEYLSCSDSEEWKEICRQLSASSCKHARDLGLMCVGCRNASLETALGLLEHVNITDFGDVYSGPCKKGLSSQKFMFTCTQYGEWIEHINQCTNTVIGNIRLQDRSDYYMEGFVEALVGDTWLPVCGTTKINYRSYYFGDSQAKVICSMIGKSSKRYAPYMKKMENPGVTISHCFGNETSIDYCQHITGHACQYHAWIACTDAKYNIKSIQLENGTSPYDGRIALYVDNTIGTVCFDGFDYNDAKVVCRMLGLSASWYYVDVAAVEARYAMIKDLACSGNENHINNCSYISPSTFNECEHKHTRLLCVECGRLDVRHGNIQSFDYKINTLTVRCDTDNPRTVQYICNRNGTWTNTTSCKPMLIQGIRLVGNNSMLMAGTVELKINNVWGTICDNGFGYDETTVLCRMMNYSMFGRLVLNAGFGPGSGTIHMDAVRCNGHEENIHECLFSTVSSCSHADDVGIICDSKVVISGIRLVEGSSKFNGVVEMLLEGLWHSLCGDGIHPSWLCSFMNMNYLHYHYSSKNDNRSMRWDLQGPQCPSQYATIDKCTFYSEPYYGYCRGPIILVCSECPQLNVSGGYLVYSDDGTTATLTCYQGYTSNITSFRCQGGSWSNNNVACILSPPLNVTHVRLADGPNPYTGRLEIAVNNTFGTICEKDFSILDGNIACKSINTKYRAAAIYNGFYFGQGTGPIYIDQLDCTSDRAHIKDCAYRTTGRCNHTQDVSLVCNG